MELILIRHGLPQRVEREAGAADPELSEEGWQHAKEVGEWLHQNETIHSVYASPMRRARQTAEPFATAANHDITLIEEIAEFDRSARNYIPMEQLKKENYAAWQRMSNGNYGSRVDLSAFRDRVVSGMETIINDNAGKRVAVFCHGGVVNIWSAHCLGMEPQLFSDIRYCSISRYLCASTGQRNLFSLNETQHLS